MNVFNIKKSFELKRKHGWNEIYFCIDLHGTIIPSGSNSSSKDDTLEFYPDAKEVLQWLSQRKDIILILWTSLPTTKNRLDRVWQWLKDNDINFDYFNSNPHAKDTPRSDFSKKFYFSVLLDDRAGFEPETDWGLIKQELQNIGEYSKNNTINMKRAIYIGNTIDVDIWSESGKNLAPFNYGMTGEYGENTFFPDDNTFLSFALPPNLVYLTNM